MKYLSVCSGIEAASVAFEPLGWKPLAFSEIEAFPRAVLRHHYAAHDARMSGKNVQAPLLWPDFTSIRERFFRRHGISLSDVDLFCGGTPCQAFSVAGLRQSLADDRGNLTLQFVKLADAIDNFRRAAGREPAWILWENVPGVLSTSDNAFGAFLGGLCGRHEPIAEPADGWTRAGVVDGPSRVAAWRVMDAQYFGLAQRRQRVFVLALGGAGRWAAADALLPIIESGRWHPAPRRGKGEVAPTIPSRSTGGGGLGTDFDCDGGLIPNTGEVQSEVPRMRGGVRDGGRSGRLGASGMSEVRGGEEPDMGVAHTLRGEGFDASEDGTGRGIPLVMAHGQANAEVVSDGSPSLTCNHEAPILVRMREGKDGGGKGPLVSEDQSLTLATANDQVLAVRTANTNANGHGVADGITHTLDQAQGQAVMTGMQVRRLTPRECERLQGFPDGYTAIPWRGKPAEDCPDGPRYKALGNSWAVNVVKYIGQRIQAVKALPSAS